MIFEKIINNETLLNSFNNGDISIEELVNLIDKSLEENYPNTQLTNEQKLDALGLNKAVVSDEYQQTMAEMQQFEQTLPIYQNRIVDEPDLALDEIDENNVKNVDKQTFLAFLQLTASARYGEPHTLFPDYNSVQNDTEFRNALERVANFDNDTGLYRVFINKIHRARLDENNPQSLRESMAFLFGNKLLSPPTGWSNSNTNDKSLAKADFDERVKYEQQAKQFADLVNNRTPREPSTYLLNPFVAKETHPNAFVGRDAYYNVQPQNLPYTVIPPLDQNGYPINNIELPQVNHKPVLIYPDPARYTSDYQYRDFIKQIASPIRLKGLTVFAVTEDNFPKRYANLDGTVGPYKLADNKKYIETYLNYKLTGKNQRESQSKAAFIYENGLDKVPSYEQMKKDSHVFDVFLELENDYVLKRNRALANEINAELVKPRQSAYRPPSIPVESKQAKEIQQRLYNKAKAGKLNEVESAQWQQFLDYKRLGVITEWVENDNPNSNSYGRRRFVDNINDMIHQDFPGYLATGGTILEFINKHKLYEFQGNRKSQTNRPELKSLESIASEIGHKTLMESALNLAEASEAFGEANASSLRNVKWHGGWLRATVYGSERNGGVAISDKGMVSISSFKDGNVTFSNGKQAIVHPTIQGILNDYYKGNYIAIKQHLDKQSFDKWFAASQNEINLHQQEQVNLEAKHETEQMVSEAITQSEASFAEQFTKEHNFKELQTFLNSVFTLSNFHEDKLDLSQNYYLAETKGFVDFSQVGPDVLLIKNGVNDRQKTFFQHTGEMDISSSNLSKYAVRKVENGKQVKDGAIYLRNNDLLTRLYRFGEAGELEIAGAQHIYTERKKNAYGSYQANTTKNHVKHTEKKGAFTVLFDQGTYRTVDALNNGQLENQEIIFVEGQATGISAKKFAPNAIVVFYGDAHNLEPVLDEWVGRFGKQGHDFIIAADNDHTKDKLGYFNNVGKSTAVEAVANMKAEYGEDVSLSLTLPDFQHAKTLIDQEVKQYVQDVNELIKTYANVDGASIQKPDGTYDLEAFKNLQNNFAQRTSDDTWLYDYHKVERKVQAANTAVRRSNSNSMLKGSDFNDLHKNIYQSSPILLENDAIYRESAEQADFGMLHADPKINEALTRRKVHELYRAYKLEGEKKEFAEGTLLNNVANQYFSIEPSGEERRQEKTQQLLAEYGEIKALAQEFSDLNVTEIRAKQIASLATSGNFSLNNIKKSLVESYESKAATPIAEQLVARLTSEFDLKNNEHYGRLMLDVQSFTKDADGHIYANGIINNSNISVAGGYQPKTASIRLKSVDELRAIGTNEKEIEQLLNSTEPMEALIGKRTDAQGTQMLGNSQLVLAFKNVELNEIKLQKNSLDTQFTKHTDGKINHFQINAAHLTGVAKDYLNLINTDITQAANPKTLHNNAMATLNFVSRSEANALTTNSTPYLQLEELHGIYETTHMGQDNQKILEFLIAELDNTDAEGNLRRGSVEIRRATMVSPEGIFKDFTAPLYIRSDVTASEQAIAVEGGGFIKTTVHTPINGLDTLFNIVVRQDRRTSTAESKISQFDLDNISASDAQTVKSIAKHVKHLESVRDFLYQSGLSDLIVEAKAQQMGLTSQDLGIDPGQYLNTGSFFDNRYSDLFMEELGEYQQDTKHNQQRISARIIGTTTYNLVGGYNSHIANLIQADIDAIEQGRIREETPIMKMVRNGVYQHTSFVTEHRQDGQVAPVTAIATNYLITGKADEAKSEYVWEQTQPLNKLVNVLNNPNTQGAFIQTEGSPERKNWLHSSTNLGLLAPNTNLSVAFENPNTVMRFVANNAQKANMVRDPMPPIMNKSVEPLQFNNQLDSFYDATTLRSAERKLKTLSVQPTDADALVDMLGKKIAISPAIESVVKHIQTLSASNVKDSGDSLGRDAMVNNILNAAVARSQEVRDHFKEQERNVFIKGLGRNDNTAALFLSNLLDERRVEQLKDYIRSDEKLATERNIQGLREVLVAREQTLRPAIDASPIGFNNDLVDDLAVGLTAVNNQRWLLNEAGVSLDAQQELGIDIQDQAPAPEQTPEQSPATDNGADIGLTSIEENSPSDDNTPTADNNAPAIDGNVQRLDDATQKLVSDYQYEPGEALAYYLEVNELYPTDSPQREWLHVSGTSTVLDVGNEYHVSQFNDDFELVKDGFIEKAKLDNADFGTVHQLLTEAGLNTIAIDDAMVAEYVTTQNRLKEEQQELAADEQDNQLDSDKPMPNDNELDVEPGQDNTATPGPMSEPEQQPTEDNTPAQGELLDGAAASVADEKIISQQIGEKIIGRRTDKLAMITADVFAKKGISAWGMGEINKINDPYVKAVSFILRDSIPEKPRKRTRTFSSASVLREWAEDAAYKHELFTTLFNNYNDIPETASDFEKYASGRSLGLTTLLQLQAGNIEKYSQQYKYNMYRIDNTDKDKRNGFIYSAAIYNNFVKAEVLARLPFEQWKHISVENLALKPTEVAQSQDNPIVLAQSFVDERPSRAEGRRTEQLGFNDLNNHDTTFKIKNNESKFAAEVAFRDVVGMNSGKLQNIFAAYSLQGFKEHLTPESAEELNRITASSDNQLLNTALGVLGKTAVTVTRSLKGEVLDNIIQDVDIGSTKNIELSQQYPLATDPTYNKVTFFAYYNSAAMTADETKAGFFRFKEGVAEEDKRLYVIKAAMSSTEKDRGNVFEIEKFTSMEDMLAIDQELAKINPSKERVIKQDELGYSFKRDMTNYALWDKLHEYNSTTLKGIESREKALEQFVETALPQHLLSKEQDKKATNEAKPSLKKTDVRNTLSDYQREGEDYDFEITDEAILRHFGFMGVEFSSSNYIKPQERAVIAENTLVAYTDMAKIIGLPTNAIGLGGQLGLTIGRHGGGARAAAFYDPRQFDNHGNGEYVNVGGYINITRSKGLGTCAHEWAHALDNYLIDKDEITGNPKMPSSLNNYQIDQLNIRDELKDAYKKINKVLDRSGMAKRCRALPTPAARKYWSDPAELFARGFEAYVKEKGQQLGIRNDFLVNVRSEQEFAAATGLGTKLYPYPTKEEMPQIMEAYDDFLSTLQQRTVEKVVELENAQGKREMVFESTALFSRAATPIAPANNIANFPLNKRGQMAADAIKLDAQKTMVFDTLAKRFGEQNIQNLLGSGLVEIITKDEAQQRGTVKSVNELNGVEGFYKDGKSVLVADNLTEKSTVACLLHELGAHHGFQKLMSEKAYAGVMNDVHSLIAAQNPIALEAQQLAMRENNPMRQELELLPYMLTAYENNEQVNPQHRNEVERVIDKTMNEMKLYMRDNFGFDAKLNPTDLAIMAEGAIIDMAEKVKEFDNDLSIDALFSRAMPQANDSINIKVPLVSFNPNDAYRRVISEMKKDNDVRLTGITDVQGRTTHYNFTQFFKEDFAPAKRGDDVSNVANPDIHHFLLNGGSLAESKLAVASVVEERALKAEQERIARLEQQAQELEQQAQEAAKAAELANSTASEIEGLESEQTPDAKTENTGLNNAGYGDAYIRIEHAQQDLSQPQFKALNDAAMTGFKAGALVDKAADVMVIYSQNDDMLKTIDHSLDKAMSVNDNKVAQDALVEFKTRILAHTLNPTQSNPTIEEYGINERFANMLLSNIVQKAAYNPKDNTGLEAVQALNQQFAARTPDFDLENAKEALKEHILVEPIYDKQLVRGISHKIRNAGELNDDEIKVVVDIMAAQYRDYPQATERLLYGAKKVHEYDADVQLSHAEALINDQADEHIAVLHKGLFNLATKGDFAHSSRQLVTNTARYELVASVLSATMSKEQADYLVHKTENLNQYDKLNPLAKVPKEPSSPFELGDFRAVLWVERFISDNNHKNITTLGQQRKSMENLEKINNLILSQVAELTNEASLDAQQSKDNEQTAQAQVKQPQVDDVDLRRQVGQGGVFDINVQDYVTAYLTNDKENMKRLEPLVAYFKDGNANKMVNEFIDIAAHDTAVNNHLRRALTDANIKDGNILSSYPTTKGLVQNEDFAKVAAIGTAAVMQVVKNQHLENLSRQDSLEPDLIAECTLHNSLQRREFNHQVHGKDGTLQAFKPIMIAASKMATTDHAVRFELNIEPKVLESKELTDSFEIICDDDLPTQRAKSLLAAITISHADMNDEKRMAQKLHTRDIVESSLKAIGTDEALKFVKLMKATNPNAEHYQDLKISGNMANKQQTQTEAFSLVKAMLNESAGELSDKTERIFNHATRYGAWSRDIERERDSVNTMKQRLLDAPEQSINGDFSFLGQANKLLEDLKVVEKVNHRYVNSKIFGEYKPIKNEANQASAFEATVNELKFGMEVNTAILEQAVRVRAEHDENFVKTAKMLGDLSAAKTAKDMVKLLEHPKEPSEAEPKRPAGWEAIEKLSDMFVVKAITLNSNLNSYQRHKSFDGLTEIAGKISSDNQVHEQLQRFKVANEVLQQNQQRQSNNDASIQNALEQSYRQDRLSNLEM